MPLNDQEFGEYKQLKSQRALSDVQMMRLKDLNSRSMSDAVAQPQAPTQMGQPAPVEQELPIVSAGKNIAQGIGGINMMIGKGLTDWVNVLNPTEKNTLYKYGKALKDEYDKGQLSEDAWGVVKSFVEPIVQDVSKLAKPFAEEGVIGGIAKAGEEIARRPFDYTMDALFFAPMVKGVPRTLEAAGTKSVKVSENIINSLIRPKERQYAYGKNPGRGVAREGIVATSMEDLGNKISAKKSEIGKQIEQKITNPSYQVPSDYSSALNAIDSAIAEASKNPRTNATIIQRLENHKLDIMGAIQDADGNITGYKRDFTKLTPAEAWEIKKDIGRNTKFTGNPSDDAIVNKALKGVYGGLDSKLDKQIPGIDQLNGRYADLLGAEIATKHREIIAGRNNILGLPEVLMGTGGIAAGGARGAGIGVGTALIYRILSSTPAKTIMASALNKGASLADAMKMAEKALPKTSAQVSGPAFMARQETGE